MKISLVVAWYDLWIGVFWDRFKRKLYILPMPCIGIAIEFPRLDDAARLATDALSAAQVGGDWNEARKAEKELVKLATIERCVQVAELALMEFEEELTAQQRKLIVAAIRQLKDAP